MRQRLYSIIFESDTFAGRLFDAVLICLILLSVVLVMLDSIRHIHIEWGPWLWVGELMITGLFTVEYLLRLWVAHRRARYAFSFYGVVDLLAILPFYISLFFAGFQFLTTIRIMRVLRIFRVLKLVQFLGEGNNLWQALKRSRYKITVFLTAVISVVVTVGSLMYLIEGPESSFSSIPRSIYWAIVTMTTVGYGDIAPKTPLGQLVASLLMITGYGIIAVPTGIVTSEMMRHPAPAAPSREGDRAPSLGVPKQVSDEICPCCGKKRDQS